MSPLRTSVPGAAMSIDRAYPLAFDVDRWQGREGGVISFTPGELESGDVATD
jgi:hypothetical protein